MSRSRKKPYITDQNSGKPQYGLAKRFANRKVRRENKKAVEGDEAAELHSGNEYKKVSESWDIRDWSFHLPKDKKAFRK
jgi:hypothetical protein